MKLPKRIARQHNEAVALALCGRALTLDEREFVLEHFHEGAETTQSLAGAFFTPPALARDFSLEVHGSTIVDLCAGIGALSFACRDPERSFVCVEANPLYVEIGKAIMPEAQWICGDIFEVFGNARRVVMFDHAISNPPFGGAGPFEYRALELASRIARSGTFIVPQQSAPFRLSGMPMYFRQETEPCRRFRERTGIVMEAGCGIDTSRHEWKNVNPKVEIVCIDFDECVANMAAVEPLRYKAGAV